MSFIITYYDEGTELLSECLRSIALLPLQADEREMIVVDDGSQQFPLPFSLLDSYHASYLRQENQGVSAARNAGLRFAHGRYVQFVDADDMLMDDAYAQCLQCVRKETPDVVAFDFSRELSVKRNHRGKETKAYDRGADYMLSRNMVGSACCYLWRSDVIEDIYFSEGKNYSEDEEFTARAVSAARKLVRMHVAAYYYRERPLSATQTTSREKTGMRLSNQLDTIKTLQTLGETLDGKQQKAMNRRVAQLGMDYLYNTMVMCNSEDRLEQSVADLKALGLFPLPKKQYTLKYALFRRITSSTIGRKLLKSMLAQRGERK